MKSSRTAGYAGEAGMVKLDAWERISKLKQRITKINSELVKVNRYLSNPFGGAKAPTKTMWRNAAKKKKALETELAEVKKELETISDKAKLRGRR
jgi:valyl-tRNA synthetase